MLKSDLFVLSGLFDNASHFVSAIGADWPAVTPVYWAAFAYVGA